jgi:hypothetical protein
MKISKILFVVIVMMTGFTARMNAQATENTSAAVQIVTPITVSETSSLHFGTMAVLAGNSGSCVLSTQGVRTQTGGVNLSAQAPTASNAAYNVSGAVNTTYAITLPASITVTESLLHTATMVIDNLAARTASAGANGLTGTLSATGTDSFTVGGTLNVGAGQSTGLYTGSFDVTVAYN